jgi:hypothetical protein
MTNFETHNYVLKNTENSIEDESTLEHDRFNNKKEKNAIDTLIEKNIHKNNIETFVNVEKKNIVIQNSCVNKNTNNTVIIIENKVKKTNIDFNVENNNIDFNVENNIVEHYSNDIIDNIKNIEKNIISFVDKKVELEVMNENIAIKSNNDNSDNNNKNNNKNNNNFIEDNSDKYKILSKNYDETLLENNLLKIQVFLFCSVMSFCVY